MNLQFKQGYYSMKRLLLGSTTILLLSATVSYVNAETLKLKPVRQQSQQLIAQNMAGLMATDQDGLPSNFTKEKWLSAKAQISTTPIPRTNNYQVTVKAQGLVPNGLYTFWWVNKKIVGMDMGPAGGVQNNFFRADSNGNATKTITVSANNYQMLVVAYHADNQTHGEMPGEMGKVTFSHLAGNFPK